MTDNPLKVISAEELNPVPVFSCIVILGKPDDSGWITARVANLDGIKVDGKNERDILTAVMKEFRAKMQLFTERGEEIPWIDPPEEPADGESHRFIPIHL